MFIPNEAILQMKLQEIGKYFQDGVRCLQKIMTAGLFLCHWMILWAGLFLGSLVSQSSDPYQQKESIYGTRFSWPKQLALLKRCFMVMRYKLNLQGKNFVIINLHNSTFDKGGTLRIKELKKLHSFCLAEYSKGNYVLSVETGTITPGDSTANH